MCPKICVKAFGGVDTQIRLDTRVRRKLLLPLPAKLQAAWENQHVVARICPMERSRSSVRCAVHREACCNAIRARSSSPRRKFVCSVYNSRHRQRYNSQHVYDAPHKVALSTYLPRQVDILRHPQGRRRRPSHGSCGGSDCQRRGGHPVVDHVRFQ